MLLTAAVIALNFSSASGSNFSLERDFWEGSFFSSFPAYLDASFAEICLIAAFESLFFKISC